MTSFQKPRLSIAQIINMSFGFLGIQFGFALQNGNASRIFQTFGADVEHLSLFWLAAPLTGMIVQPIIGHYSDRTWTKLGRRRPYFLVGSIISAIALVLMPNSALLAPVLPPVLIGAGLLMIMDASFNVAMEPFRALVGDKLPESQRTEGFAVQTVLIGVGAVFGSWLPYVLAEYLGISKTAPPGHIPDNVVFSFYTGAIVMIATIVWTIVTTKEYSPKEMQAMGLQATPVDTETEPKKGILTIFDDFANMPTTMKQLGWVQFFSWFGLFSMWVFTTPAVAYHVYGVAAGDTSSTIYADAGNWVGILFGVYNGVSAVYAIFLPRLARKIGRRYTHAFSLVMGGLGLIAIFFISDPNYLLIPMVGIGMAWGSILSMPYAILSGSLPAHKMGVYMGLFNFFITFPQIVNGLLGGYIVKYAFDGNPIYSLVMGGVFFFLAAYAVLRIKPEGDPSVSAS